MASTHAAETSSLYVRVSNAGAHRLYSSPELGYENVCTLESYYADGEGAFLMRARLDHLCSMSDFSVEFAEPSLTDKASTFKVL
jgi:hypothetical protein